MTRTTKTGIVLAAGAILLAGCNETATKEIHVRPPAAAPAPAITYAGQPLPLSDLPANSEWLIPRPRPAIDVLVDAVQARFDAGQQELKAGSPDKAQADFERAADIILKSGFPADSDPRLAELFDQLGDVMHSDTLGTQSAEEDESETPAQPAPIDEIADLTLPAGDPRLALKAQNELMRVHHDLPLTVNEFVLQYLSFFTTTHGRAIVEHGLERAGRYNEMIRRVLKEEGMPQDLIYLAQAESAFQPQAVSRAGARGIWQFMPFRGEEYDLERTYWVDDRSDPEKATRAAARHMRDLYGMFGDWYLVMAAYNAGPVSVSKAIERTGYADFWELRRLNALPKQTQNYVPIIIALALVAKDPALYGIHVDPEKAPVVEAVKLQHPIDLHLVADAIGADYDDLRLLNPELLRSATPNEASFELKLPTGSAKTLEENIAQVPEEKWTSWRLHTVEDGETLSEVARRFRVTVPALESANHLEPHANLPAGFELNVPVTPPVVRLVHYRVRRGDTLEGIADRFDVTVQQLKRWNRIAGTHAPRGALLRIYAGSNPGDSTPAPKARSAQVLQKSSTSVREVSAQTPPPPNAPVEHRVKQGETLYSIAREYQTTVSSLVQSNPFLADRSLQAGDILAIRP